MMLSTSCERAAELGIYLFVWMFVILLLSAFLSLEREGRKRLLGVLGVKGRELGWLGVLVVVGTRE